MFVFAVLPQLQLTDILLLPCIILYKEEAEIRTVLVPVPASSGLTFDTVTPMREIINLSYRITQMAN